MASEFEAPIRGIRDNLASIVDRAETGSVTYVTRRGARVAAIVPVAVAQQQPKAEPQPIDSIRPLPSAAGGRLVNDQYDTDTAFTDWNRAALEALHIRLTNVLTQAANYTGLTGRALAALSEGHFGTVEYLLDHVEVFDLESELNRAVELYAALTDPDDAECTVCGSRLNHFYGQEGWQHWREVDSDLPTGRKVEIFQPDPPHEPKPRWIPRERPAIVNGDVEGDR